MQNQFPKFELDKNRRRVKVCPCGKSNKDGKFVPYVGYEDKGYCHACGELFLPPLSKNNTLAEPPRQIQQRAVTAAKDKPESLIPFELFRQSLKSYADNNFIKYLLTLFGDEITQELIETYYIGTSRHWSGATVFWQIDKKGYIRTGKIMLYNQESGKRIKEPFNYITWAHHVLKINDYRLKQCLFGEHLLSHDLERPVAITESEKTAIISSVYLPQYIWLAAGSISNLTTEKCLVLEDRNVVLFPDLNAYDRWEEKKEQLSNSMNISIFDYLEINASDKDKKEGLDIADFLMKYNWKDFNVH
ncbi:MAG: hypothetical protein E6H09_07825 [Bacteroidetes bacterium]|jgi:hypothetical protein|nr:MAG: hypothetical protein E6H09_07825 [Bacteroidota bacterium]